MKYHVTYEMMDRELRFSGKLIRTIYPVMTESIYGMVNRGYRLFLKGKWKSKKTNCTFREIPREDGSKMRILVVTPKAKKENRPGFLWIHGGGYSTGVPEMGKSYMERIAAEGNCVVVSPDYRLSVEAPYPAALEDGYLALKWLKEHAKELGVRNDQLFVGGESAGGGLATAVTMYARDRKEVAVAFLLAIYPMLDDRFLTESSKNNDAPVWNTESNQIAWKKYLGDLYGTDKVPVYAAPARCADFEGLPPICAFVGSLDPFCDETTELIRNYENAGIKAHFKVFDGAYHGFDTLAPKSRIGKEAIAFYMESLHYAIEHYFAPQS